MLKLTLILAAALAVPAAAATQPASAPASAPAERVVRWHETHAPAAAEAAKRKCLLLVVYFDPAAPACEAFEQMTLTKDATRQFLADFAACRLNVNDPAKKQRFAKTGLTHTPLTQVFAPDGSLLDEMAGCILPASRFREQLRASLDYRAAATARPFDAAARWRAVEARLKLSSRREAVADIDKLLKLPAGERPAGVTPARLYLARGSAQRLMAPEQAREDFDKAIQLAPRDAAVAGKALLALADMAWGLNKAKDAHQQYSRYLKEFPAGPDVGTVAMRKAALESETLKDPAAGVKTLEAFIRKHPDDPKAVSAKALLDSLKKLQGYRKPKPKPVRKPTTKPAMGKDEI